MGSWSINEMRDKFPGMNDRDAAKAFAEKSGYIAIVRYKSGKATDYTNIGTCSRQDELNGYLSSPYCHDVEIIYKEKD